jgi:hypothetical protein
MKLVRENLLSSRAKKKVDATKPKNLKQRLSLGGFLFAQLYQAIDDERIILGEFH